MLILEVEVKCQSKRQMFNLQGSDQVVVELQSSGFNCRFDDCTMSPADLMYEAIRLSRQYEQSEVTKATLSVYMLRPDQDVSTIDLAELRWFDVEDQLIVIEDVPGEEWEDPIIGVSHIKTRFYPAKLKQLLKMGVDLSRLIDNPTEATRYLTLNLCTRLNGKAVTRFDPEEFAGLRPSLKRKDGPQFVGGPEIFAKRAVQNVRIEGVNREAIRIR